MINGKHELVGLVRVETPKTFTLGPLVGVVISHIDLLALQSFPHFSLCENSLSLLISIA
jgi:hypothetical protein